MILQFAKILIFTGFFINFNKAPFQFKFSSKIPYFGKLPGDIYISSDSEKYLKGIFLATIIFI